MEKELVDLFNILCEHHKDYISKEGTLSPMIFFIKRNNSLEIMLLIMRNSEEKELFKRMIKERALKSEIKGYIVVMDAKMTSFDKDNKDKTAKVQDAVISHLFTAKGNIVHLLVHDGKKIIEEENTEDFSKLKSDWDIWGEGLSSDNKEEKDILYWYRKQKENNPDKYEGCK